MTRSGVFIVRLLGFRAREGLDLILGNSMHLSREIRTVTGVHHAASKCAAAADDRLWGGGTGQSKVVCYATP
eukprot:scaffold22492_cov33-Tisochrysis_lutea.AAC.1